MAGDIHITNVNTGAFINGIRWLFQAPTDALGGGISVAYAACSMAGSANSGLTLILGSNAGTPANVGTIGAEIGGTALWVGTARLPWTISTPFVDAGQWVGVSESNLGTTNAWTNVCVGYQMGK